jgi:hypothetical protein
MRLCRRNSRDGLHRLDRLMRMLEEVVMRAMVIVATDDRAVAIGEVVVMVEEVEADMEDVAAAAAAAVVVVVVSTGGGSHSSCNMIPISHSDINLAQQCHISLDGEGTTRLPRDVPAISSNSRSILNST